MNNMRKTALIVVDVQNDFCPGGSLAVADGDQVVKPLNELIEAMQKKGQLVIASRDWHPEVTSHFKDFGGMWPKHCIQNSYGAEFHPMLETNNVTVVSKATKKDEDAYSAFDGKTDNGTPLNQYLKENEIEAIFVGGLATDYCVKATVLDALKNGYETIFVGPASRAVNLSPDDGDNAIKEMEKAGAIIIQDEPSGCCDEGSCQCDGFENEE